MKYRLLIALFAVSCAAPQAPQPIEGAQVQLAFEKDLANLGAAALDAAAHDGAVKFKRSPTGRALAPRGAGDWISFDAATKLPLGERIYIAFDFAAEDWENPYPAGRAKRTIADVMSKSPERVNHIAFSLSPGDTPYFEVWFKDAAGDSHRLRAEPAIIRKRWNSARLEIDRAAGETRLLLNTVHAAQIGVVPAAIEQGVDAIKLGTWHKKIRPIAA